jgi:hypothetical protein
MPYHPRHNLYLFIKLRPTVFYCIIYIMHIISILF